MLKLCFQWRSRGLIWNVPLTMNFRKVWHIRNSWEPGATIRAINRLEQSSGWVESLINNAMIHNGSSQVNTPSSHKRVNVSILVKWEYILKTLFQRVYLMMCEDASKRHGWCHWILQGTRKVNSGTTGTCSPERRKTRWREVNECGWIGPSCCCYVHVFVLSSEQNEV